MSAVSLGEEFDEAEAKELFQKKCSTCHGIQDYDMSDRSLKEWQLTVERMATYGGEEPYTDEEADKIIAFLYLGKHEPLMNQDMYAYDKPDPGPDTQPTTGPALSATTKPRPRMSMRDLKATFWRKSKALYVAKVMGYIATGLMAVLVVSGLTRKTLKRNFLNIHRAMAIALFGAFSVHISIYLCEYGVPSVLWLWFGIIASVLIGLVEFGGLIKHKLGGKFIKLHSICGAVGLILVVLHWFWTSWTYQLPT